MPCNNYVYCACKTGSNKAFSMLKFILKLFTGIALLLLFPFASKAQNGVYFVPSLKQTDSIRIILAHTNNDTLKMCAYYYITSYYTELNKDSAEYYAQLQLNLADKLKQKLWAGDALFQTSYINYSLGNYPKALEEITRGLVIVNDPESEKGNWQIKRISGDGSPHRARLFIASALHQIFALLYDNADNMQKSGAEFSSAIKIAKSVDDQEELSLDYMSFGYDYLRLHKPDSALLLENKAYDYAISSNYRIYVGDILTTVGDIYFSRKNYSVADGYYHRAMAVNVSQNNLRDVINISLTISKLKRTIAQPDSALYYSRKALAAAEKFSLTSEKADAYNSLFLAYKSMNKIDSAFAYLQLAKSLGDSLNDAETMKTNQFQRLNLNQQIDAKEKEKAAIEAAGRTRIYIFSSGIAVLLLIAFLLFRNSQNRKKANELLQAQKQEIEQQKGKVETTLTELKATQQQLIQSEKMASLGELTAGIAHEIQNPLNFVNNFSEVSNELMDEMNDELAKGDIVEAQAIADDIKQNLEKINHHGKRADAIVKGMLQHSQLTKGAKELTDINALCDDCLHLSYGMQLAKDSNFNVEYRTEPDESIGKATVVPQDMAKALVNIINNAFYAVNEKQKTAGEAFKPLVLLQTKKAVNNIEITISDNGTGISEKNINKVFQPFFTTKPTGQFTGLGLSLAYDIITKEHGGSLTVESEEKMGSKFKISVPV